MCVLYSPSSPSRTGSATVHRRQQDARKQQLPRLRQSILYSYCHSRRLVTCNQKFAVPMTRSSALSSALSPTPPLRIGSSPTVTKHVRRSLVNRAESASCESTVSSCSCCCSSCPASFCLGPVLSEETVSADAAAALPAAAVFWYVSLACCAFLPNHSSPAPYTAEKV